MYGAYQLTVGLPVYTLLLFDIISKHAVMYVRNCLSGSSDVVSDAADHFVWYWLPRKSMAASKT